MAIVQISRITNRLGLTENLPQLSGAELGWATDSRRLFIGNGTLSDGAPVVGNTEILTEFSDITVLSDYTYADIAVGYAAQTGPGVSQPVVRTLQAKLDDMASVRDFGAVGDGQVDDTAAINRALFELYCRENNSQIRRSLFFPAGTYLTSQPIVIPTHAKLLGEGADSTIIRLAAATDSSLEDCVARYGDSRQQTGVNIGNNGAIPPRNIEISSMTFQSGQLGDVFLVESAEQCWFDSVFFKGALTEVELADVGFNPAVVDTSAVKFLSTNSIASADVNFDRCRFLGTTTGVFADQALNGATVANSAFLTLYYGVRLTNLPTGVRIVHNQFTDVYAEGVLFQNVNLNVTAYNVFYNVGNSIGAGTPTSPVISFSTDNNVSIGDVFSRSDSADNIQPRIRVTAVVGSANAGGSEFQIGRYNRSSGRLAVLADNQPTPQPIFEINASDDPAFKVMYTIVRGPLLRIGTLLVVNGPTTDPTTELGFSDEYNENDDVGVILTLIKSGNIITVQFTSTATAVPANFSYSVSTLA